MVQRGMLKGQQLLLQLGCSLVVQALLCLKGLDPMQLGVVHMLQGMMLVQLVRQLGWVLQHLPRLSCVVVVVVPAAAVRHADAKELVLEQGIVPARRSLITSTRCCGRSQTAPVATVSAQVRRRRGPSLR